MDDTFLEQLDLQIEHTRDWPARERLHLLLLEARERIAAQAEELAELRAALTATYELHGIWPDGDEQPDVIPDRIMFVAEDGSPADFFVVDGQPLIDEVIRRQAKVWVADSPDAVVKAAMALVDEWKVVDKWPPYGAGRRTASRALIDAVEQLRSATPKEERETMLTATEAVRWAKAAAIWVCATTPSFGSLHSLGYTAGGLYARYLLGEHHDTLRSARELLARIRSGQAGARPGCSRILQLRVLLIFIRRLTRHIEGYEPPVCGWCSDTGVEYQVQRPDYWPVACHACQPRAHRHQMGFRQAARARRTS